MPGTRHQVSGTRYQVPGTHYQVPGNPPGSPGSPRSCRSSWRQTAAADAAHAGSGDANQVGGGAPRPGVTPQPRCGWVAAGGEPWFHKLLPQVWNAGKPRLVARLTKEIDKTQKEIAKLQAEGATKRQAIAQSGQGSIAAAGTTAAARLRAALRQAL